MWEKQPFYTEFNQYYKKEVDRPETLEKMYKLSRKLAKGFPFVRVDFYDIEGKLIFGEMTFYPADGKKMFIPLEYNKILGEKIQLPSLKNSEPIVSMNY